MGCDIHLYVEKLDPETKEWQFVPPEAIAAFKNRDGSDYMVEDWYWGRNYDLFALLANVRNGFGFAGVDTGDPIVPIEEPRGIPSDASPEYRKIAGPSTRCDEPCAGSDPTSQWCTLEHGWGADGHSHSWFTLRELQAADYDQTRVNRGVVTPAEYVQWRDHGHPTTWSGGVSGGGIETVDVLEMERRIQAGEVDPTAARFPDAKVYCRVEWQTPLRECMGDSWFSFLERASRLTLDDGNDVRALFFFDN